MLIPYFLLERDEIDSLINEKIILKQWISDFTNESIKYYETDPKRDIDFFKMITIFNEANNKINREYIVRNVLTIFLLMKNAETVSDFASILGAINSLTLISPEHSNQLISLFRVNLQKKESGFHAKIKA